MIFNEDDLEIVQGKVARMKAKLKSKKQKGIWIQFDVFACQANVKKIIIIKMKMISNWIDKRNVKISRIELILFSFFLSFWIDFLVKIQGHYKVTNQIKKTYDDDDDKEEEKEIMNINLWF